MSADDPSACKHTNFIEGHWEGDDWIDEVDESLMVDIDLHRMRCSCCGYIGYYSSAARRFYEEGITCNIKGLDGVTDAPLPA